MQRKTLTGMMASLAILSLLVCFSCTPKATTAPVAVTPEPMVEDQMQDSMTEEEMARKAAEEARIAEEDLASQKEAEMRTAKEKFVNENIQFDFDSALLSMEAQAILRAKAMYMKETSGMVTIEGHCDERGTNEYNLALGDRRARSAKAFLVDLGISASRISTVSYGEERPIDPGHNETAWSKNRRVHFKLKM